jgi:hypothetical protein
MMVSLALIVAVVKFTFFRVGVAGVGCPLHPRISSYRFYHDRFPLRASSQNRAASLSSRSLSTDQEKRRPGPRFSRGMMKMCNHELPSPFHGTIHFGFA